MSSLNALYGSNGVQTPYGYVPITQQPGTGAHVSDVLGGGLGGALGGAATGAMIGSIIPGLGTLLGAGIGALVGGLFGGLGGEKKYQMQKQNAQLAQNGELQSLQYINMFNQYNQGFGSNAGGISALNRGLIP